MKNSNSRQEQIDLHIEKIKFIKLLISFEQPFVLVKVDGDYYTVFNHLVGDHISTNVRLSTPIDIGISREMGYKVVDNPPQCFEQFITSKIYNL